MIIKQRWFLVAVEVVTNRAKPSAVSFTSSESETCKSSRTTVDHKGGLIEVLNTQTKLKIPKGAIPEGETVDVTFSAHWGGDHPPLARNQFLTGPAVHCEPNFAKFSKPVTITIPHSVGNVTSENITVWTKRKDILYCRK